MKKLRKTYENHTVHQSRLWKCQSADLRLAHWPANANTPPPGDIETAHEAKQTKVELKQFDAPQAPKHHKAWKYEEKSSTSMKP